MIMMLMPGAGVALALGVWRGHRDGIVDTDARTGYTIFPIEILQRVGSHFHRNSGVYGRFRIW